MNKFITVVALAVSFLLGGCVTTQDWSRTMQDATTIGMNSAVGAVGGAIAGGVICRKGDRNCRQSYTGTGMLVGVGAGASQIAERQYADQRAEYMRAAQEARTDLHCEKSWNGYQWVIGRCTETVRQTTFGGAPARDPRWVPR